jgi:hypothetical protein
VQFSRITAQAFYRLFPAVEVFDEKTAQCLPKAPYVLRDLAGGADDPGGIKNDAAAQDIFELE